MGSSKLVFINIFAGQKIILFLFDLSLAEMDVDENLTSNDKVQVNKGKYDGQFGTITSITANSTRKNAVLTYIVLLLGDAFTEPVSFLSKDLKKVEAFPQQHPADLDDPSKKRKITAS